MKTKILSFIKSNIVLIIAVILAITSCFFVPFNISNFGPNGFIDYDTLILLFSILLVIAGLKATNVFEIIANKIISIFKSRRTLILAIVFTTFFFDMIVANDMSLITLLPISYLALHMTGNDKYVMITFILQTIAANMGGMITPYGNPQNLYLYNFYQIPTLEFFKILIVYTLIIAVLLILVCLFIPNQKLEVVIKSEGKLNVKNAIIFGILFVIVILSIFRLIPRLICLGVVLLATLIFDIKRLLKVDYGLLFTFFAFFIFSGNLSNIPVIKDFIINLVNHNVLLCGILSCQLISNVPTAILLSKFTTNYADLLVSVNVGSLGILISSLASLITLKEYLKNNKGVGKYIGVYTLVNTIFLIILIGLSFII